MHHIKVICFSILVAIVLLQVRPEGAAAQQDSRIRKITPPSRFEAHEINYVDLAKRYFAVIGRLDAVYENHIVVRDHSLPLSSSADISGVSIGTFVGAELDDEGRVTGLQRLDPDTFNSQR